MTPKIDQKQLVDSIASQALGAAPAQAAPPQAAPPQAVPPQTPPQAPPTPQEKVEAAGSPQTEGDKAQAPPMVFDVPFGEQTRKLTPEQIASTFDRYSKLNHQHAQMAPVMQAADAIMRANKMDPTTFARQMIALAKQGGQRQTVMGDTSRNNGPETTSTSTTAKDFEDRLAAWEQDNGASLPPGYKEMMQQNQMLSQAMGQQNNMLKRIMAGQQGIADAARATNRNASMNRQQAIRQTIGNNIDRAQQALGLPDSDAQDFMTFSTERGYTLEDFASPQLVMRVMQDFKNNRAGPEMERFREMAKKRQAYSGALGSSPSMGAPSAEEMSPADKTFNKITDHVLKNKLQMG